MIDRRRPNKGHVIRATPHNSPVFEPQRSHPATSGARPRISNSDEPTLGRLGTGLQAVWPVQTSPSTADYGNDAVEQGIQAGQILPSPTAFARAPGSVMSARTGADSLSPDERIAMVSRPGGVS
ncbi:MAG: hypothetical protein ACOYO9_08195 [Candidatus Nanopelagicales bacterium]